MGYLSKEQIHSFHTNGYLVINDFWNIDTIQELKATIGSIIANADLSKIDSIFSTKDGMRCADDYFLNSGGDIRFFWEEKAWKSGSLVTPPTQSINKIGHALHDLDPVFSKVSYEARLGSICHDLNISKPLIAQSMYIFKQAEIGGEVLPHQDGAFLYTEPQSCLGFWWPLDDCTLENGCLWAVPGSHLLGVHRRFRKCDAPKIGLEFVPQEPIVWDITSAVPLVINKGSLVILHNALVHFSNENLSRDARHAYSIHVVDGVDGVVYPSDNWLQRPVDFPFKEIF
jgi:phytanoyl-CoA hydroxylase